MGKLAFVAWLPAVDCRAKAAWDCLVKAALEMRNPPTLCAGALGGPLSTKKLIDVVRSWPVMSASSAAGASSHPAGGDFFPFEAATRSRAPYSHSVALAHIAPMIGGIPAGPGTFEFRWPLLET